MEACVRSTIDDSEDVDTVDNKDIDDIKLRLEENRANILVLQWFEGLVMAATDSLGFKSVHAYISSQCTCIKNFT